MDIKEILDNELENDDFLLAISEIMHDYLPETNESQNDNPDFSTVTIDSSFNGHSYKFDNYKINIKDLIKGGIKGVFSLVPARTIGSSIAAKLLAPALNIYGVAALLILTALMIRSDIIALGKIKLSRDHILLLYALWNKEHNEDLNVEFDKGFEDYTNFMEKNEFRPKLRGDFKLLLKDLNDLKCIQWDNNSIKLIEKLEFNSDLS